MENKSEENYKKLSEKIFIKITRKKAKQRINKEFKDFIKNRKETLSKDEIKRLKKMFMQVKGKKIIEEEARKARKKTTILALIGALGIVGTGGYTLGENEKSGISGIKEKNGEIQIDMNEVEKDINIKNIMNQSERNEHQVFVKELQEQSLNENLEYIEVLKKEVTQEIENLKTKEEVLSYTKQMYVDRYNGIHEEPIGVGNVTIRKNSYNKIFYEDHAKNGDIILRQCTESEAQAQKWEFQ